MSDDHAIRAKPAGLDKAWAEHRADVEEAIANAARIRGGFKRPTSPAAEPTPAYRAPGKGPQA